MSHLKRSRAIAVALTAVVLAAAAYGLGPSTVDASSHREAPLIAADPAVDNTDLYAFASPDRPGYVTFVMNFAPFSEPNGGPNFFPFATDAAYLLHVDNDGDAREDAVFRWIDTRLALPAGEGVGEAPGGLAGRTLGLTRLATGCA
jgi:Domain of unknown function (DUF4331)